MDTIIALSTFPMKAALAVVRMSGDKAFDIYERIFKPKNQLKPQKRQMVLGELDLDTLKDSVMAVKFPAPHSFTGEDMVEFHTHGSMAIVRALLHKCVTLGARTAAAGEFTKRAFLNGKLNLCSAEAVIDLIDSQTAEAARAAYEQSEGSVFREVSSIQDALTSLIAHLEVANDYPEEDIIEAQSAEICGQLDDFRKRVQALLDSYQRGRLIKDGVSVVIFGKPNVGKSSLLNAMLGFERAIVSQTAGTTRDTVNEAYEFLGVRFELTDTAGVREAASDIEKMGIDRSYNALKTADLILHLYENDRLCEVLTEYSDKTIAVLAKCDLGGDFDACDIAVSSTKNHNIDALKQLIYDRTVAATPVSQGVLITSARHFSALTAAKAALDVAAGQCRENCVNMDLLLFDLREAWSALGDITGQSASESIIDEIFKRFCVGK